METFHGKQVPLWYIPPVASDAEWAWAAGIFEMAGAVVTINSGRDLRLALNLTDEDVVRRYAEIVESRVLGPYHARPDGALRLPTFRCNLNCRFAIRGARQDVALARQPPPGSLPRTRFRTAPSNRALTSRAVTRRRIPRVPSSPRTGDPTS